jgi:hypothetical protein
MVAKNPLRPLDQSSDGGLAPGQLGLVAARAGTGKTAFLIQVALDSLFRGNPVLHLSVGETVSHVQAWYREIFRDLADGYDLEKAKEVWSEVERNRFIMTFRVESFSVAKLEERLADLVEQEIFRPRVVLVDKLDLGRPDVREDLEALGSFARAKGLKIWVSGRTHRDAGEVSSFVEPVQDLFQVAVSLDPQADATIALTVLKNPADGEGSGPLRLDPRTLLLHTPA